jgi:RPA family protein
MSSQNGGDGGPGTREVARRLFAAEFDDAEYSYSESDEERAPNYVVSPTGERINRLFTVGVLTEVSQAGDSILRARVADPTGAFVVYAGQYQPEAMAFLDRTEPPAFVAATGKARTFQPDDSEVVYSSVRPEEMNVVDRDTRDRWVVTAAERTLHRAGVFGAALDSGLTGEELRSALVEAGVEESLAAGVPIAIEQYGTTRTYLSAVQELALDAVRLVAGDLEEVGSLDAEPGEGDGTFTPAVDPELALPTAGATGAAAATASETGGADSSFEPVEESGPASETAVEPSTGGSEARTDAGDTDAGPGEAGAGAAEESTADAAGPGTNTVPEPGESEAEPEAPDLDADADADLDADVEFDPEEEVLDEEAREEVEEEFGLEFETGSEVESGDAGESPAEPTGTDEPEFEPVEPEPESESEADADSEPEPEFEPTGTEQEPEPGSESEPAEEGGAPEDGGEAADDRPVDQVLIDRMESLDDGGGVPREELIAAVTDATDADEAAVEAAIEDALMSGRCYEPDEGRYASI